AHGRRARSRRARRARRSWRVRAGRARRARRHRRALPRLLEDRDRARHRARRHAGDDRPEPRAAGARMTFAELLAASHPTIDVARAERVLAAVADGYSPIWIARHAVPGGIDETELAAILDVKERWDALRERQRFVAEEIARQGRLMPELRATIEATF